MMALPLEACEKLISWLTAVDCEITKADKAIADAQSASDTWIDKRRRLAGLERLMDGLFDVHVQGGIQKAGNVFRGLHPATERTADAEDAAWEMGHLLCRHACRRRDGAGGASSSVVEFE